MHVLAAGACWGSNREACSTAPSRRFHWGSVGIDVVVDDKCGRRVRVDVCAYVAMCLHDALVRFEMCVGVCVWLRVCGRAVQISEASKQLSKAMRRSGGADRFQEMYAEGLLRQKHRLAAVRSVTHPHPLPAPATGTPVWHVLKPLTLTMPAWLGCSIAVQDNNKATEELTKADLEECTFRPNITPWPGMEGVSQMPVGALPSPRSPPISSINVPPPPLLPFNPTSTTRTFSLHPHIRCLVSPDSSEYRWTVTMVCVQVHERLYANAFNRGVNTVSDADLGPMLGEEGAPTPAMDAYVSAASLCNRGVRARERCGVVRGSLKLTALWFHFFVISVCRSRRYVQGGELYLI